MNNKNKFHVINPMFLNEVRLKIMVVLERVESADFVYLCRVTNSTRGNLGIQIMTLEEAGYIEVRKTGIGRLSHTVCRLSRKGREALQVYEDGLSILFKDQAAYDDELLPAANIAAS